MTDPQDVPRAASVGLFSEFVGRYSSGLKERIETDVEPAAPAELALDRDAPDADLAGGALVGRTVWSADGIEHAGCFLWFGDLGSLLGGSGKNPADLSEPEIETLDQSLRLNIEEGGESDFGMEWSPLEFAAADRLPEVLRESGAPAETGATRISLRLGESEMTFLFLEAPVSDEPDVKEEASAPEAADSDDHPAPVPGNAGEPAGTGEPAAADGAFLEHLLDLRLPLTIRLGSAQMNLEDLLRLAPGSVVELDQREDEPLEVLANGRTIARGEVVVIDDRFGLRITEVGARDERIRATL